MSWLKFDGLMSLINLQMLAENDVTKFSRFRETAKRVKFRQADLEMKVKDVDDLAIVRSRYDSCRLANAKDDAM